MPQTRNTCSCVQALPGDAMPLGLDSPTFTTNSCSRAYNVLGGMLRLRSVAAEGLPVSGDLHRKVTWEALATLMPTDCSVSRKCCSPSGPGVYVILCVTPRYRTLITLAAGLSSVGVRAGRQSGSTALQNRHRVSSLQQATGFGQEAPAVNCGREEDGALTCDPQRSAATWPGMTRAPCGDRNKDGPAGGPPSARPGISSRFLPQLRSMLPEQRAQSLRTHPTCALLTDPRYVWLWRAAGKAKAGKR